MKLLKKFAFVSCASLFALALTACPDFGEGDHSGGYLPEDNPSGTTEESAKNGEDLIGTLWFYDGIEIVSTGEEGTGSGSGSGSGSTEGEGSGSEGGQGSGQQEAAGNKVYVHFLTKNDVVFGKVSIQGSERVWTPMYAGTWGASKGNISFAYIYKAIKYDSISRDLYSWMYTGKNYTSDSGYDITVVPSDYGLKSSTTYKVVLTNLSFVSGLETHKWTKQLYTDEEIDGLKVNNDISLKLENETFVTENAFISLVAKQGYRVYLGSVLANEEGDYAGTYSFGAYNVIRETSYASGTGTQVQVLSRNCWSYCGGKLIVSKTDKNKAGWGEIYYYCDYDADKNTLALKASDGSTVSTYIGGKTIYAEESELTYKSSESSYTGSKEDCVIPKFTKYPSLVARGVNTSQEFIEDKPWCYQNATYYSVDYDPSSEKEGNPAAKMVYAEKGAYTLEIYDESYFGGYKTFYMQGVLPERFKTTSANDMTDKRAWTVDVKNGEVTIMCGEDEDKESYTFTFFERPTYGVEDEEEETVDVDLQLNVIMVPVVYDAGTAWEYESTASADRLTDGTFELSLASGTKIATSKVTFYANDSNAKLKFNGQDPSDSVFLADGMTITIYNDTSSADYILHISTY